MTRLHGDKFKKKTGTKLFTVEPKINEPLCNKVLSLRNDILQPGQSYREMCGTEPRYNEPDTAAK